MKSVRITPFLSVQSAKISEINIKINGIFFAGGYVAPFRGLLYVDDLADPVFFALENKLSKNLFNVGTGKDLTTKKLAETIQRINGHTGEIIGNSSKPDGTPPKLLIVGKLKQKGWSSSTPLDEGIRKTYRWFLESNRTCR